MKINTNVQFEIRGTRGIGKTHLVETLIVPALEAAGYVVHRVGAERWEFDIDKDGKINAVRVSSLEPQEPK